MTSTRNTLLKATCVAISMTGALAVLSTVAAPTAAFAKNDNAKNKKSKANKKSSSAKKEKRENIGFASQVKVKQTTVHPSELGALNAAHANENALLNASPNSRVGRIAAYRDIVIAGQELQAEYDAASAELALMDVPTMTSGEIETALETVLGDITTTELQLAQLEIALAEDDVSDPAPALAIQSQIDAAKLTLGNLVTAVTVLDAELIKTTEYETAAGEVADLNSLLLAQPELETLSLEAAANKPVTPEVELAIKEMLDLVQDAPVTTP